MNILNVIKKNVFLDKLFPDGIAGEVEIGEFCIGKDGRSSMRLHVKQKPAIEVKKWGIWGRDFDTIALILSGSAVRDVEIVNWEKSGYSNIKISEENGIYHFLQTGIDWKVSFYSDYFIFQQVIV